MLLHAIEHVPDSSYCYAVGTDSMVIRLRTAKDDVLSCSLFYGDRVCMQQPIIVHELPMEKAASDFLFDYYEVTFTTDYNRVCYYFKIYDGSEELFYYGREFSKVPTEDRTLYYQFPYIRREEVVSTPSWAQKAVMYQIFPDSFASEKRGISILSKEVENSFEEVSRSLNGGTIRGIIDNIDYLVDLGIDCLYLNPIFTAEQWHKYDTIDYMTIDPCFGTMEEFKELVQKCHLNNIKVLLDGVFNHSGWKFFAFKDVIKNGEKSNFKDWYYNLKFPLEYEDMPNYECFAYVKEMPKLNTSNPEVIEYFTKVGVYWIKEADIDGWRLDVANEVDHDFWRCFRKAVKGAKKDAFLIAEIWEDAHNWLNGDQFDSAMNYKFSSICTEYFGKGLIDVKEFDSKINSLLMRYKGPITLAQMNLLDSHDVPRFLSRCGGNIERFKLAVLYQMMFVGIPSVFYGDEKGVMGIDEKEYRRPMTWEDNEVSKNLWEYYKKLIAIRKSNIEVMLGRYRTLITDVENDVYGFMRSSNGRKIVVILNCSDKDQEISINIDCKVNNVENLLNSQSCSSAENMIKVNLQPLSAGIYVIN